MMVMMMMMMTMMMLLFVFIFNDVVEGCLRVTDFIDTGCAAPWKVSQARASTLIAHSVVNSEGEADTASVQTGCAAPFTGAPS